MQRPAFAFLLFLLGCCPQWLHADAVSRVAALNYPAWLVRDYATRPLPPGAVLAANDLIRSGDSGRVRLDLDDNTWLWLGSSSRLLLQTPSTAAASADTGLALQLLRGVFRLRARAPAPLRFKIGAIDIELAGAELWGRSDDSQDLLCLLDGSVTIVSAAIELVQPLSCYVKPRRGDALPVDVVDLQQQQLWLGETELEAERGIARRDGSWQLVLFSLTDRARAEREMRRLRELGLAVSIKSVIRQERTLHRLLLPGFESIEAAQAAGRRIGAALGIEDAWVWKASGS